MSGWMDNVPQFDWWDYKITKFGRISVVVSEAKLPFGCKAEIRAYTFTGKLVTYVSHILTPSVRKGREAYSLEDAKENARESWIEMLAEAIGDSGSTIKPLSWAEQDGNTVAYGANNMGFIIEQGSDGYIIATSPEQQYTKSHFGFKTTEDAKAWCERYNNDLVEEAMEWVNIQ